MKIEKQELFCLTNKAGNSGKLILPPERKLKLNKNSGEKFSPRHLREIRQKLYEWQFQRTLRNPVGPVLHRKPQHGPSYALSRHLEAILLPVF